MVQDETKLDIDADGHYGFDWNRLDGILWTP